MCCLSFQNPLRDIITPVGLQKVQGDPFKKTKTKRTNKQSNKKPNPCPPKKKPQTKTKKSFSIQNNRCEILLLQLLPCQIACKQCANPSPVWTLSAPTGWIWTDTTRQRMKMRTLSSAPSPGRMGCATAGASQRGGKRVSSAPWIIILTTTPPIHPVLIGTSITPTALPGSTTPSREPSTLITLAMPGLRYFR